MQEKSKKHRKGQKIALEIYKTKTYNGRTVETDIKHRKE